VTTPVTSRPPAFPRPVLVIVGLAGAFVVVAGLRELSDILGPAFLALVLTVAAQPIRPWLVRRGLPTWVGTVLALVVIYAVLLTLALSLAVAGARFATLIPTYEEEFKATVTDGLSWLEGAGVGQEQIDGMAGALDLDNVLAALGSLAADLLGVLSSLFFVVTLVLFMVVDASTLSRNLLHLPPERRPLVTALGSFAKRTRTYLIVSSIFGLIVAAIDTVALLWIGVPLAWVWGLLAFITNYVPNIGFVIGVIPPAVIGLLEGGAGTMITVIVVYCAVNLVIQSVIQPRVVGEAVGLSPTLTMLSLVFWAYALGAVGALMAVPLTLLAKALLVDADSRSAWISPLLDGSEPAQRDAPGSTDERPGPEVVISKV
jgi:AI-2 transport protein TqsA